MRGLNTKVNYLTDEEEFILRLKDPKSKEAAFRELLKLYKERLYWHIRKIVISHDDADDVLQNTFIKVYRSIDKFKGESQLFFLDVSYCDKRIYYTY